MGTISLMVRAYGGRGKKPAAAWRGAWGRHGAAGNSSKSGSNAGDLVLKSFSVVRGRLNLKCGVLYRRDRSERAVNVGHEGGKNVM